MPEAGSVYQMDVPAEWVQIPTWSAHFYLGLSVNFDQKLICVEGYATQRTLVERAIYRHLSAEYALDQGDLETELDNLCLEIDLQVADVVAVQPTLKLSPQRASTLINALSHPQEVADPRSHLPFAEWAALLADRRWQERLYERRVHWSPITNLLDWLSERVDQGWQRLEQLTAEPQLVYRNLAGSERAKVLDLGEAGGAQSFLLALAVQPISDYEFGVRISLLPLDGDELLPPQLTLTVFDDNGEVLHQESSGGRDERLQYEITLERGDPFAISVRLGELSIIERFTV
jgi:hypothetical protein